MPTNTYVALDKKTVASNVSFVEFTSIPQTYTDLILEISAISTSTSPNYIHLQYNGDTGSNYSTTILTGNGSTASSTRFTNRTNFNIDYFATPNTEISTRSVQIMNYSNTTTNKTGLVRADRAGGGVDAMVGMWRSTAAITSIKVTHDTAQFAPGTTFSLYGIAAQPIASAKATGGTITYAADGYTYHSFTSSGTFTPSVALSCEVLSVGAGGGGGWGNGGGGGAGELDLFTSFNATTNAHTVTVGGGGAAGTGSGGVRGSNGTASSLVLGGTTFVSSLGGGGGGTGDGAAGNATGAAGGSGGGGNFSSAGGSASGSNTFAGGTGTNSHPKYSGGGGGGATEIGANAFTTAGGNGGQGYLLSNINTAVQSIFSSMTRFASGGGGGTSDINGGGVHTRGTGGAGAGSGAVSNGGSSPFNATAGTSYGSGGGGGAWNGGSNAAGGTGAGGVVIIRYAS